MKPPASKKSPSGSSDAVAASVPQTTPTMTGFGHADHSFTLQAIMELKGSLAELKVSFDGVKSSVDSMKTKVEDLVGWKNKILGGALVLGAVISLISFMIGKNYVTFGQPSVTQSVTTVAPTTVPSVAPAPTAPQATKLPRQP